MKRLSLLIATFLGSSILLNGCATMSLLDRAESKPAKQYEKDVLAESVIAVGYPNVPIGGYESAMLLAGKNYSFLVQPIESSDTPENLFQTLFSQVDLNSLYIDPMPTNYAVKEKMQAKSNTLILNLKNDDSKQIKNVTADIGLIFVKPVNSLRVREQSQIEQLGFECNKAIVAEQENIVCQRTVPTAITVASAVQNINNVNYKLKQPLTIEFNYQGKTKASNKEWLKVFTPVAIAVDIVTLPVQALAAGVVGAVVIGSLVKWSAEGGS